MRTSLVAPIMVFLLVLVSCKGKEQDANRQAADKPGAATQTPVVTPYAGENGLQKSVTNNQQGQVAEEGDLLNGQKEGTWVTYHNSGLVASVTSYRGGKKHGFAMKADDTGSITERMFYVNDQLEGKRFLYNHTRVKEEANYRNGKLDGERKLYYDDGKVQEEGNFKNGKRDGIAKWYDQQGSVTIQYTYKDGEKVE